MNPDTHCPEKKTLNLITHSFTHLLDIDKDISVHLLLLLDASYHSYHVADAIEQG